jgi:para-aminobenzoate synthetase/4-amino-4-deoxychorismate lyase
LIADGECYQLNYTFPCGAPACDEALTLYRRLLAAQRPPFGALMDTGRFAVLSASPELFFAQRGQEIVTRPMKGTAPRGRFPTEDRERIAQLRQSAKEQAENLMIVDLLRNDLGQVATTGSVRVEELFRVETYPTLHQMTSTVRATLREGIGLTALLAALFPCGSVTGAPKRRAMELIARLEEAPRGVYCGAIGHVGPGEATFAVAIRTLLLDREAKTATLGVGSGITWDAEPAAEYAECLTKATFVGAALPPRLIESLRLEEGHYARLPRHLARLAWSAGRLGHPFAQEAAAALLQAHAAEVHGVRKVRLLLDADGGMAVSSEPLPPDDAPPLRLALATEPVDPDEPWPYLKSERRDHFARARAVHPDADEVLFTNLRGELTEGSYHSLVVRLEGRLVTPPLTAGLLPGVMREELLAAGTVTEQTLTVADLQRAEEIWLVNSVRGWRRAMLNVEGD